jgi:NSS family neurotransmitter:Na+ symporter
MNPPREQWASRYGFLLASIGGAVGIGNIWRFSYVAGENGGAVFLFIYLACVVLIGIPLMIAELAVGRHAQGDAITAFQTGRKPGQWGLLGWAGVIAAALLLSYYAVIAGWVLKYFAGAATGALWQAAGADYGGYFRQFIADRGEPLAWQAVALALAMFVVAGGVRRGIERINRTLIPLLALMIVVLAGYALSLPGSRAGVAFLFEPDWTALRHPGMYAAALGQTFFSLGVGMAFFVTYGSYMPRTFSIPASAAIIAGGDTLFALIAGLAIFPAVFALSGSPAAGPELAFITLPQVFLEMPAGDLIGAVFFLLLFIAATTSMVALLEIPVAALTHRLRMRRWAATACMGAAVFLIGVPSALSYGVLAGVRIGSLGILDAVDLGVSNFLLPAIGIGTAVYVGWRLERNVVLTEADFSKFWAGRIWLWLVRILVPVTILGILFQSVGVL